MKTRSRAWLYGAVTLWWLLVVGAWSQGWLQRLEWALEDGLWQARWALVAEPAASRVALVLVNRTDVTILGGGRLEWPLSRAVYARVLERLARAGARAVGFDMTFAAERPEDAALASAMAGLERRVVLGAVLTGATVALATAPAAADDDEGYDFVDGRGGSTIPCSPALLRAAWGQGAVNAELDLLGSEVTRAHPLAFAAQGKPFPGLALATFLAGTGGRVDDIGSDPACLRIGSGPALPSQPHPGVRTGGSPFGAERIVTPRFCRDWRDRYLFPIMFDVLAGTAELRVEAAKVLATAVRDRFVIVAVGDDLQGDTIQLPNQPQRVPGCLMHALLLDGLTQGPSGFMTRITGGPWLALPALAALLLALLTAVVQARLSAVAGFLAALASFAAVVAIMTGLFCAGVVIFWAPLPATFVGALVLSYFHGYLFEGREKAMIKEMFGKQVSPEVVEELLRDPGAAVMARRQEISVAFVDVCGFTRFSESHTPERVLIQLNYYFHFLVKEIMKHRGTLDKFIGDALMMTTGVPLPDPDHALHMVRIALAIRDKVAEINRNVPAGFEPFTVSCGINSGDAILGNVGSQERMEYTVIGDTVNLAARLQSASKSQEIVVGPRTYELTRSAVRYEPLAPLTVKGKAEPIQAYRALGLLDDK